MQSASVLISVGGDAGNTVPKIVSAAEIPVLQGIHGDEAVHNIEPRTDEILDDITGKPLSNREELNRLKRIYGGARDGENHRVIDVIYPGAGARLPETIDELGLPEQFFKPTARATAAPAPVADPLDHDGDGKKGGSKGRKAKPAPIVEAPPAEADEAADEVGEMPDAAGDALFK